MRCFAPSTTLRVVPRFAGEDPSSGPAAASILPRLRGRGTAGGGGGGSGMPAIEIRSEENLP